MFIFEEYFKKEYNKLYKFYNQTIESYNLLLELNKLKSRSKKTLFEYLYDIIIVKLVSITENYFVEIVKDLYIIFPERFLEIASSLNFDFPKILKKEDISSIHSDFLKSIIRSITSGGHIEAKKTIKKISNINFESIKSYNDTLIYYDYRNLIIHRLGKTDEAFRIKYNTFDLKLKIDDSFLEKGFKSFYDFCFDLSKNILKTIDIFPDKIPKIKDSYITCVLKFKDESIKKFFSPDHVFIAEDDIVRFGDLIEQYFWEDNILKMTISGTQQAIEKTRKALYSAKNGNQISIIDFNIIQYKRPNYNKVSRNELEEIKKLLPKQPWEKGIHKKIALKLGFSNSKVSDAITILINNGTFMPQKDGKLFKL